MERRWLRVVAPMALFAAAYGVAQTALLPALPSIERELHTNPVGATSVVSVFFVAGAVTSGIFGRLGDMFGKRRLIVIQLLLGACGLVVCALARDLASMIVGRAVMGSVAGVLPLGFSILRDELPIERVPAAVAIVSGLAAGGGALGQLLGGVVTDGLGYRWIFWLGAIIFVGTSVSVRFGLRESATRTGGRVDVLGAGLLAAAIGGPLLAISRASTWGWSDARTVALLMSAAVTVPIFVAHERRATNPLLSLPTLVLPQVRTTNLATFLIGFGMFGSSAIISQFVQTPRSTGYGFGADATQAALFLAPGTVMMLIASPLAGALTRRAGAKPTLLLGCLLGCAGLASMTVFNGRPLYVYLWVAVLYFGIGCTFGALPLLILEVVPSELRGQSTGVNLIVRSVGSALGLQVAATLVASSIGAGGLPAERGYAHAFAVEATAVAGATLLALLLPRARSHVGDSAVEVVPATGA